MFPSGTAKGIWGTGTRRKRAAEREFTLPQHVVSDSAKSFEKLQAEAEAEAAVEAATAAASQTIAADDQLLNKLSKATSTLNNADKETNENTDSSVTVKDIEDFLHNIFDKLEILLNSPDFVSNIEDFLIKIISLHFKTVDPYTIRALLQENAVLDSAVELQPYLLRLRQLTTVFATSIREDLSPEDLRLFLSLDFSKMSGEAGPLAPELIDFSKRMLNKYMAVNLDLTVDSNRGSSQDQSEGLNELLKMFSSLQHLRQEGGLGLDQLSPEVEALLSQFQSTGTVGCAVQCM